MALRASKPTFNVREKLTELGRRFGLKGSELAAAETVQEARDLVSAGRKNLIINGGMTVAQRGTSVVANANSTFYTCDRFVFFRGVLNTSITGTQQTVTDLPGHTKSFRVTSSGNASIVANSDSWIKYNVEDKDFDQVNWLNGSEKFVTLSFWAKSNRTGQFSVSLNSGTFVTAKNINTFTLDSVNTWKKITFTYPAPSTWAQGGNTGARIYWAMGTGTTYYTSNPNLGWMYNNSKFGAVGDTQIYGDDGAYFEITGVQLEVGKNATDFEHRPIGEELALCQRYCVVYGGTDECHLGTASAYTSTNINLSLSLPTTMRVGNPSLSRVTSGGNWLQAYIGQSGNNSNSTPELGETTNNNVLRLYLTSSHSGLTAGQALWCQVLPNAKLIVSAEL